MSVGSRSHFKASFFRSSSTVRCSRKIAWYSFIPVSLWRHSGDTYIVSKGRLALKGRTWRDIKTILERGGERGREREREGERGREREREGERGREREGGRERGERGSERKGREMEREGGEGERGRGGREEREREKLYTCKWWKWWV